METYLTFIAEHPYYLLIINGLICACLCTWLAEEKGRSAGSWFISGFFLGELALLTLGFAPSFKLEYQIRNIQLEIESIKRSGNIMINKKN